MAAGPATQRQWRVALASLGSLLFPHEVHHIEEAISEDPELEMRVEAATQALRHPLKLVDVFKCYLLPPPQRGNLDEFIAYNNYMRELDTRVADKWTRDSALFQKKESKTVDFSQTSLWLPPEHNPFSLGREGSARVRRIPAKVFDIALRDFSVFWSSNKAAILGRIPAAFLRQRVTDEADNAAKIESYTMQRKFLVELAKGIAAARGVTVGITSGTEPMVYEGKPDGLITIGDRHATQELKTKDGNLDKIAIARGQVVILGNSFMRQKSRYEDHETLENELLGFVGTGIELQVVRQIHCYMQMVQAFDGPLLPLAEGTYRPQDYFDIDTDMPAVHWAAAALDRMVMCAADAIQAGSEVSKDACHRDYGRVKLTACDGYWIGREYLRVANSQLSFSEAEVTVTGGARNNEMALVLQVRWDGELWWLKTGPDVEARSKVLQPPHELPIGGWERWFQTERDMLSRGMLQGDDDSTNAFAVVVQGLDRPAMLVKDAGDSLEKQLFSRQMTPEDVHEMSKQIYEVLQAAGDKGVIHGDVCLENVCYVDGRYTLIDWGLACGRPFVDLVAAVDKAWPGLGVRDRPPGIPNWEMSAHCYFCGVRPYDTLQDMESLLYCCMKILGGNVLPWSEAARSGSEFDVLQIRTAAVRSFVQEHKRHIYEPLLFKLSQAGVIQLVSAQKRVQVLQGPKTDVLSTMCKSDNTFVA